MSIRTPALHWLWPLLSAVAAASVLTQGHVLEFTVEPSDTVVESGQSAVLDCVVRAAHHQASVLIQWLDQDGSKLTFIGDLYRSQLTNGSLYINSVLEEQRLTGTYQCMASLPNVGSIVSRTAKLSIASLMGFHEEPSDLTVYIGQRAYFACYVDATPSPKIRWLKDERPLQIEDLRMVILPSGALEIDEVAESDQGSYRCNASGLNSFKLSNKAVLYINGDQEQAAHVAPPSFIAQPRPGTFIEGQNVSLDCAANGNPMPSVTWLKDGYPIDMNDLDSRFSLVGATSSLRITRIQEQDGGTYQCRAENREDTLDASALIEIQVPPKFLKKPQDRTEIPSKDVELECSVYGVPEPRVHWFKNGELVKYSEYYKLINGYNLKIMGLMTTDSGLFQCFASNRAGNIQAAASLKVLSNSGGGVGRKATPEGLPGPPRDLKAPVVKGRFVILSWKPPAENAENIQSYSIYYRHEGSDRERYQNTSRSKLEEINIGGLLPGRVYHFRVVAHNNLGTGDSSEILTVTTQSEEHVASAPLNLDVYATSPRNVHINWQPPETPNGEILRYTIYYMETSSSIEHNIDTIELSFDLNGLTPFTEYSVWIVAVNHNGAGAATEEKLVKTFSTNPSEPPINITTEPSSTSIVVRWEPPPPESRNGVILGYKIRIRQKGKGKSNTYTAQPSDRHFVIGELERGSIYQLRMWANNVNGSGPGSEWIEVETFENDVDESRVPDQPYRIQVRPFSDKLYVMWTPPNDQSVRVRHYILGWGKGIPDMYNQELDEKNRTYIIDRLEPNSEYVLSIRASNEIGAGPPIYTTVRTQEEPPPEPPKALYPPMGLKALVLSPSSIVLYWTDPSLKQQYVKDNRYYVVKYTDEKSKKSQKINVTDLNVMIDDLKPNTLYDFSVKLVKGHKESPWSMEVQNRTWELPPNAAPRDLDVHFKDEESQLVELTWLPPKMTNGKITGYVILFTHNTSLADPEWNVSAVKGDVHSTVIYDLKPFTVYYFKVQARNSRGIGPFSNIATFRTGQNVAKHDASQGQPDSNGVFSSEVLLYVTSVGCLIAVITIAVVTGYICCRRRDLATSPDRTKKGYQKGTQNIKPPDLWIHHDQMELKAMEKRQSSTNDGASSSGAMTLPRSVGGNDYDNHDNVHTNSLDKRSYVPNYGDDRNKKPIKTKPITLPVESKPPREPIATPINAGGNMSQSSSDSTPSSRPAYPRTQYSMPRAHVNLDPVPTPLSQVMEPIYPPHHVGYDTGGSGGSGYSSQPPPVAHVPPGAAYAPGLSVLAESQGGKRLQGQGHPLKSFTVPAPPPISAPGTPQPKHIVTVRPTTASPYKKPPQPSATAATSATSTPSSRINQSNPPPHTAEEVQKLNPSHSTEELNQEMANLEGLMLTLNAITANEFEC